MEHKTFDIVVIGGGTGGYVAAIRASQLGLKTALVEREKVGGVCLHRGCIPTKVLLQSADVFSLFQKAAEFGISVDASSLTYDYAKIRARVEKIVSQLHKGVEFLLKKKGVTLIKGHAVFSSRNTLHVYENWTPAETGEPTLELSAPNMLLSTGSHWKSIDGQPNNDGAVIDADGALNLPHIPKEIVICGGGQTGVEFASLYASFGAKVHLLEAGPRLLPAEDAEVSAHLDRMLSRRGIQIYLNTRLTAENIVQNEGGVELNITVKDKSKKLQAEHLLVAVGRTGNTANIGLDKIPGLQIQDGFVVVDNDYKAAPGVYAVGDMTGGFGFDGETGARYMLAHAGSAQGIFVVECVAGQDAERPNLLAIPRCTYTNPQVASMGLTEAQARQQAQAAGRDPKTAVKVGKFPFKVNGRALMLGDGEGFAKLVVDAESGDLLGAHLTGLNAVELISEVSLAKLFDASAWEVAQLARPHPALMEVVMEAARDADGWAIHL